MSVVFGLGSRRLGERNGGALVPGGPGGTPTPPAWNSRPVGLRAWGIEPIAFASIDAKKKNAKSTNFFLFLLFLK